jgi:HD-GYP domain-containing protein (c-di-GMP phosphodiesterase class II)
MDKTINALLLQKTKGIKTELHSEDLVSFGSLVSRIVDFRSRFTYVHSQGVAACAEALACLSGFSPEDCITMRIAGHLHDLGKLAIPVEIIEKPGPLNASEFKTMRNHALYTHHMLNNIHAFETVTEWAALHHERLNGAGYPFHYTEGKIPLGSRIMTVADIFTAVSEERPYRSAMSEDEALKILQIQAYSETALDAELVSLVHDNFDEMNSVRTRAQQAALEEYKHFTCRLEEHLA